METSNGTINIQWDLRHEKALSWRTLIYFYWNLASHLSYRCVDGVGTSRKSYFKRKFYRIRRCNNTEKFTFGSCCAVFWRASFHELLRFPVQRDESPTRVVAKSKSSVLITKNIFSVRMREATVVSYLIINNVLWAYVHCNLSCVKHGLT